MERAQLPPDDASLLALADAPAPQPPERGLFAADSWLRRVSREPVLLFGGGRALLLEIAHPLVAAGVAEHSDFRRDPFGRLQRTLDAMSRLTFGDRADALSAARSVERAHARVRGTLACDVGPFPAGTPYDGRDVELVRWVWATLVDTAVQVYELFVAPLDAAAREACYRDHCVLARLLGVPPEQVPDGWAGFREYFDGMLSGGTLHVGDQAREIAVAVLDPPGGLPGAGSVRGITAGLLPAPLREPFGLAWDPDRAQRFDARVASVRRLRAQGPQEPPARAAGGRRPRDLR